MFDQGAALIIVVLSIYQPIVPSTGEGFARLNLSEPTAKAKQYPTRRACEDAAGRWLDDLEERPLEGRTVRVFCVTP